MRTRAQIHQQSRQINQIHRWKQTWPCVTLTLCIRHHSNGLPPSPVLPHRHAIMHHNPCAPEVRLCLWWRFRTAFCRVRWVGGSVFGIAIVQVHAASNRPDSAVGAVCSQHEVERWGNFFSITYETQPHTDRVGQQDVFHAQNYRFLPPDPAYPSPRPRIRNCSSRCRCKICVCECDHACAVDSCAYLPVYPPTSLCVRIRRNMFGHVK